MSRVTTQLSVSLDGYLAGPDQSLEHPLGIGGDQLHTWYFGEQGPDPVDAAIGDRLLEGNGAYIMGRRMFGGGPGGWDPAWRGWWGADPPYRTPVFVLTHHSRDPVEMEGGTTFHFVTDGVHAALDRARAAAKGLDVAIAGGAATVQQFLGAGLLDELHLHLVPVLLGSGERLLDGVGTPALEQGEVRASGAAIHVRYRVVHPPA